MTSSRLRAVVSIGGEVARTLPTSARRAATELDRLAQSQANDRREAQRLRLEMRSLSRSSQAYARATAQQRELRTRMAERGVQIRDLSASAGQATGLLGRFGTTMARLGPWGAAAGAGIGIVSGAIYGIASAINSEATAARRIEDVAITTGASEEEVYRLGRGLQTLTGDYDSAQSAASGYLTAQGRIRRALAGQGDLGFTIDLSYAGLTPTDVLGSIEEVATAVRRRLEAGVSTDVIVTGLQAAGYAEAAPLIVALAQDQERLNAAMAGFEAADLGDLKAYDEWRESTASLMRELGELKRDGVEGLTDALTPWVSGLASAIDVTTGWRDSSSDAAAALAELQAAQEALDTASTAGEAAAATERYARALDDYERAQRAATEASTEFWSTFRELGTGLFERTGIWTEDDTRALAGIVSSARRGLDALPEGQLVEKIVGDVGGALGWLGRQRDRIWGDGAVETPDVAAPVVPPPVYGPMVPPDIAARLAVETPDVAAPVVPPPVYGPMVPPDIAARLAVETPDVAAPVVPPPVYGPMVPPDIAARLAVETPDVAAPVVPPPVYGPMVPPDIAARLAVETPDVAAPVVPPPVYGPMVPPDIAARLAVETPDVAAPVVADDVGLVAGMADLTRAIEAQTDQDRRAVSHAAAHSGNGGRRIEQTNIYHIRGDTDLDGALRRIEESTRRQVEELA